MKLAICPRCRAIHDGADLRVDVNTHQIHHRGRSIKATRTQALIVEALSRVHPGVLPIERIAFAIYQDRIDGGPITAHANIHVQINRLRTSLRNAGLGVEIKSYRGAGYGIAFEPQENEEAAVA